MTLLSIIVSGYRFGIWDQQSYVPRIERAIHPGLFPVDPFFQVRIERSSLWFPLMSLLARAFPLQTVFFTGYLLTQFFFFWAIFSLSVHLFGSRAAAALSVLFLLVPKEVGGTHNFTHDIYFTPRGTAIPLVLTAVLAYSRGRTALAGILGGIAFLLHPGSAVPMVGLLALGLLSGRPGGRLASARALALLSACVGLLLVFRFVGGDGNSSGPGLLAPVPPGWLEVIRHYHANLFITTWSLQAIGSIALFAAILAVGLTLRRSRRLEGRAKATVREPTVHPAQADRVTYDLVIVCVALVVVSVVFGHWYPILLVIQLNLNRCLSLIVDCAMIYAAWLVWDRFPRAVEPLLGTGVFGAGRVGTRVAAGVSASAAIAIAILFTSGSTYYFAVGVALLAWWLAASADGGSNSAASRRRFWISLVAGGLAWVLLSARSAKAVFLQGGSTLDWPVLGAALFTFGFVCLGPRDARSARGWRQATPRAALLLLAVLGFVALHRAAIQRIVEGGGRFVERIQIPHGILRTDWKTPDGLPYNDWIDVAKWSQTNTALDATFLIPPELHSFRIFSRRGVVAAQDDVSVVVLSKPSFALGLRDRLADLRGYDSFDREQFLSLAARYDASYAVTRSARRLRLPLLYRNGSFAVYALPRKGATP